MKSWKLSELKFIRENLHLTDAELAKHFGVSETALDGTRQRHGILRPRDGRFKPGQKVWNEGMKQTDFISPEKLANVRKTQFKKGQKPSKFRQVGETFDIPDATGKVYRFIKLGHRRQYPYGRYMYERYHGVKLTKNDMIRFRNGNTLDFSKENLERVTRGENALRNANREKAAKSLHMRKVKLLKELTDMGFSTSDFVVKRKKAA